MMGVMSGVNSENWLSIINEGTLGRKNTLNETLPSEKTIQYQPSNPSFYEQKKKKTFTEAFYEIIKRGSN